MHLPGLLALGPFTVVTARSLGALPVKLETRRSLDSRLANIHVEYAHPYFSEVLFTYGSCSSLSSDVAHHQIACSTDTNHDRLLWKIPEDAPNAGCLSAWGSTGELLGRSQPQQLTPRRRRVKRAYSVAMDNSSGIDAEGPWFDGVAALQDKQESTVNVPAAKSKEIAVVGTGMAGLMIWLNLNMVGMKNVTLVEASQRLGGRVHTGYIGDPADRQYQEMGPMRFPQSIQYAGTNETLIINDHKLVFDLATEVNRLNNHSANFSVDFIPWYQTSPNGLVYEGGIRLPNGKSPTVTQVASNASLSPASAPSSTGVDKLEQLESNLLNNKTFLKLLASNVYEAHKVFLDTGLGVGGDDWSELAYIHDYLKYNLNDTFSFLNSYGETPGDSFWDDLYESEYFSATTWKTIDGGLTRLPSAFHPLVDDTTYMNRKIQRMSYNKTTQRVELQWKAKPLDSQFQNASYDYVITTLPLALLRTWRLPEFSPLLQAAINLYPYVQVCKVGLQFQTRFWEHFELPIYGSCSTYTDIPGIGSICYPSYDINSTGPGVMLASYTSSDSGLRWASIPEEVHVQYVVDAMAEIHGDVVYQQYTGKYLRRCWVLDEYETISWAEAGAGMRKAFIPAFFKTENHVILSGEGTSYTSSWIASALEAGVRASVQLLLELGLVDEAKQVNERWMARWIDI